MIIAIIGVVGTTEDECIKKGCCWKEEVSHYSSLSVVAVYYIYTGK